MRRWLDLATLALTRLLAKVFYRSIEVRGLEHVPAEGPVLFVANHGNSLVDPLLLIALVPRRLRFLAKSTLWKNPMLYPLLQMAGAVPVFRQQDGSDMTKNQNTFARCHEELEAGGGIALFPEGISHDAPELQPLKTGAARIATDSPELAEQIRIVPVGLTFEEKGGFRSRALLVIGEALTPEADTEPGDREATRVLTDRIDAALRAVTLNFDSWQTSRAVERAAEVFSTGEERSLPGRTELAEQFSLRRAFGEGYAEAKQKHPERVEHIEHMALRYDGMLEAMGLRDDQVTARYPWSAAAAYLGDRVGVLFAVMPFAALGTLLNYLPYRLPGFVAWLVRRHGDLPATYKILTGLVFLPLTWALEAWLAASWWGTGAGIATAVIAPVTGWVALLFHERHGSMWREVLAYLTLRFQPERAATLRALRSRIRQEIDALVSSG